MEIMQRNTVIILWMSKEHLIEHVHLADVYI